MDVPDRYTLVRSRGTNPEVFRVVTDLIGASQHMQHDQATIEGIEALIDRLRHLLYEEKHAYILARQNLERRKKIESLYNVIQFLESQVQKARKALQRSGLSYYLVSVSNTVLGNEMKRIGQSMASKLQSWLEQQGVWGFAVDMSNGSEDVRIQVIASFKNMVVKGFDAVLQETILSCRIVERLAALLGPSALVSWNVQKEAAFALSALLDFNKDVFLNLILVTKVVENLVKLMDSQPHLHVLTLVSVLRGLLSAGQTLIADEIHAQSGVAKIVNLLDHKSQALKLAAMDCVFEIAYYGRMEVVENMFEHGVVQKLAALHQSSIIAGDIGYAQYETHSEQEGGIESGTLKGNSLPNRSQANGGSNVSHPFSNAVTRFALHFVVGTGLQKRERHALKQEFLKQIREIMQDDAEVANITAEVLWAP